MTFEEFTTKHELTDAKLVGDAIFISAAEYWKLANRAAASVFRSSEAPGGLNGFLRDIDDFRLYLDQEVAGTGLTVETDIDVETYLKRLE